MHELDLQFGKINIDILNWEYKVDMNDICIRNHVNVYIYTSWKANMGY